MRVKASTSVAALAAAFAIAIGAASVARAADDPRLTVKDVEKATGATGVKTVPRQSQPGAAGDLNFARGDGKLILMVNFSNAALYKKAREQKELELNGQKYPMELFAHAVPGLGDEAFASPPGKVQYVIYARKGNNAVSVSTYFSGVGEAGKPILTEAQLKQIVEIIFSRE